RRFLRPEWSWNGVLDRGKAAQIGDDRVCVLRREVGEARIGHDRREPAAVRPDARGEGRYDLDLGPGAVTGLFVQHKLAPHEYGRPSNRKADIGAGQR